MRQLNWVVLMALSATPAMPAEACGQPQVETAFDTVAPTASDILAIQIEALSMRQEPLRPGELHLRAKIRVLEHYRGSGSFTELNYSNTMCAGLRLDVGGIYLVATNSPAPSIKLDTFASPILQLSGASPIEPEVVVRASDIIKRLRAALSGKGTFQISGWGARQGMSRVLPPPPVPPPAELDEQ